MATRPVFVPETDPDQPQLVHVHEVDFQWLPGRSPDHNRVNINKLHAAAGRRNLKPLLEVTANADDPLGPHIGAENLAVEDDRSYLVPLKAAYHGSMVFTAGGPFADLYGKSSSEVEGDPRLLNSGQLQGFRFMGLEWGLKSGTMFYDWLTIHAIHRYRNLQLGIRRFAGFTDIDCRSGAKDFCHARSCALYLALAEKKIIDDVVLDQDLFIKTLIRDPFYQP